MIKSVISAIAAVPMIVGAPVFAEEIVSPKQIPTSSMFSGLSRNSAPAMVLWAININSNITCRSKARSKLLELGARGMTSSTDNAQWGIIGDMNSLVWCRNDYAIIAVSGSNYDAIKELRDELKGEF
jgi:hypothetical protein